MFIGSITYGGSSGSNTNFGLIYPAYATGRVVADKNANGVLDAGEVGLANIYLFVDYNSNGLSDVGASTNSKAINSNSSVRNTQARQ